MEGKLSWTIWETHFVKTYYIFSWCGNFPIFSKMWFSETFVLTCFSFSNIKQTNFNKLFLFRVSKLKKKVIEFMKDFPISRSKVPINRKTFFNMFLLRCAKNRQTKSVCWTHFTAYIFKHYVIWFVSKNNSNTKRLLSSLKYYSMKLGEWETCQKCWGMKKIFSRLDFHENTRESLYCCCCIVEWMML